MADESRKASRLKGAARQAGRDEQMASLRLEAERGRQEDAIFRSEFAAQAARENEDSRKRTEDVLRQSVSNAVKSEQNERVAAGHAQAAAQLARQVAEDADQVDADKVCFSCYVSFFYLLFIFDLTRKLL